MNTIRRQEAPRRRDFPPTYPPETGTQLNVLAAALEKSIASSRAKRGIKSVKDAPPPPSYVPAWVIEKLETEERWKKRTELLKRLTASGEELIKHALIFGVAWQELLEFETEETKLQQRQREKKRDKDKGGNTETGGGGAGGHVYSRYDDSEMSRKARWKAKQEERRVFFDEIEGINISIDGDVQDHLATTAAPSLASLSSSTTSATYGKLRLELEEDVDFLEDVRRRLLESYRKTSSPFDTDKTEAEMKKFGTVDSMTAKIFDRLQPTVCWLAKLLITDQSKLTEYIVAQTETAKGWPLAVIPLSTGGDLMSDDLNFVEVKISVTDLLRSPPTTSFFWEVFPKTALLPVEGGDDDDDEKKRRLTTILEDGREKLMESIYSKIGGQKGAFIATSIAADTKVIRRYQFSGFFVYCFFRFLVEADPGGTVIQFGDFMCPRCKSFHKTDVLQWFDYKLKLLMYDAGLYDPEKDRYRFSSKRYFEYYATQMITDQLKDPYTRKSLSGHSYFRFPFSVYQLGQPVFENGNRNYVEEGHWNNIYDCYEWKGRWTGPSGHPKDNHPCVLPWIPLDERLTRNMGLTVDVFPCVRSPKFIRDISQWPEYRATFVALNKIIKKSRESSVLTESAVDSAFSSMGLSDIDFGELSEKIQFFSPSKDRILGTPGKVPPKGGGGGGGGGNMQPQVLLFDEKEDEEMEEMETGVPSLPSSSATRSPPVPTTTTTTTTTTVVGPTPTEATTPTPSTPEAAPSTPEVTIYDEVPKAVVRGSKIRIVKK